MGKGVWGLEMGARGGVMRAWRGSRVGRMGCAAIAAAALMAPATAGAAETGGAKLVEAAKQEGEVHYIDAIMEPKTNASLERAFRKRYDLPDSFKFTHTQRGTGEVVATVQQEIKAGQHTIDLVWVGAPAFFKAAAKEGHFLRYTSPEWKHYERMVKRLGIEADPPHWVTPAGYAFVPAWNRKCPGFADVQIQSWKDMLNPAFKGKLIIGDVRKSFTHAATWVGIEGAMGKDYFPKLVELTQPAIMFHSQQSLQRVVSCEYPIQLVQIPGRVYQRMQEDPTLDLRVAWPQEGIVLLGTSMAILKGARHPHAAKLLMDFLMGEEGMREYLAGEAHFSFREGLKIPEAARPYTMEVEKVKTLPMNWAAFTLAEGRRVQAEFRKTLRVD